MEKARGDKSLNSSSENCGLSSIDEVLDRFHYIRAQSLPHLLSLLIHSPPGFPGQETSLLVIDSISAFFPSYFPNTTELKSQLKEGRIPDNQHLQWLLNRRWTIAGDIATHLMKLAASHQHLAVVLTNQTHTKIRGQLQATLFPVVSGGSWDAGIHNRIVLYRDWPFEAHDYASQNSLEDNPPNSQLRYAEVIKRGGRTLTTRFKENIAPFVITNVRCFSSPHPALPLHISTIFNIWSIVVSWSIWHPPSNEYHQRISSFFQILQLSIVLTQNTLQLRMGYASFDKTARLRKK
jgi:hypothetical protein